MSVPAWAVASPRGVVLLTVKRAIPGQGTPSVKRFDMAMLQALPHRSFTTTTIWTKGPQRFEGVLLRDLMRALGAPPGAMLLAHAQNAYSARIPLSSATDPGPIIAYLRNGKPMSLREKGPLWLVFPYDADRRWQTEVVYSRSIWQLDQITIAPGPAAD
ncbi:oxidoreductase [Defluviimonas sp. 20V17]|nr:oxidoreductase [Defluviimonas sp. 20V17]